MANTINKVIHNGTEYEIKDTTYSAGTWISVTWTTIANTWVTTVNGNSWAVTVQPTLVSWTNIKTVNGTSLLGSGDVALDSKVFTLTWLTGSTNLTTATQAYTYAYTNKKSAIIRYGDANYVYAYGSTTVAYFTRAYGLWAASSGTWGTMATLKLTVSSWSVTAIAQNTNLIIIASTAPTSANNGTITLVI